jgi:nucleotide-binding universal stress UspA family protein
VATKDGSNGGPQEVVFQKKILVPLGMDSKDLKGVYHALALAERMQARVIILRVEPQDAGNGGETEAWIKRVLLDLVNSATQQGLAVSYHIGHGLFEEEVFRLLTEENIDLVVFGSEEKQIAQSLLRIRSRIPIQIIQVKEKSNVNYI